jgi:hypothetical protein
MLTLVRPVEKRRYDQPEEAPTLGRGITSACTNMSARPQEKSVKGTAAREFRITSSTEKSDSSLRSRTQKKPSCLAMERATAAPPTARGETLRVSPNCAWSNGEAAVQQSTGPSLAFMTAADGPRGFLVLLSGPRVLRLSLLQAWGTGNAENCEVAQVPPRGLAALRPGRRYRDDSQFAQCSVR